MRAIKPASFSAAVVLASVFQTLPVQASAQAMRGNETAAAGRQDNAEAAFEYARRAVAAGDVRGAIAALERVLQIEPGLANIKLELGLLYLRVGQTDLARSYLEAAVNAADAPRSARERARAALRTAEGQLSRWNFSGSLFAGVQYQSNPNASPDTVSIIGPFGVPVRVSGARLDLPKGHDWSATLSGNLEVAFGLGDQRRTELVGTLAVTQNEYRNVDELDATYLLGRIGPRFYTGAAMSPSGYIQPFVSGTYLALHRRTYYDAYGVGVSFLQQPALDLALSGQVSYERRDYEASRSRPAAPDQTGNYWLSVFDAAYQISPRLRPHAGILVERVNARRDFWSRVSFGPAIGISAAMASPIGTLPWVVRLDGDYRRSIYDEADPLVSPDVKRKENQFELGAGLSVPFKPNLAAELRFQQTWNRASLPNYRYNNSLASLGVNYRF